MNLRNIPKEYHQVLYTLEAEQAKQNREIRPKYDPEKGLTIVIYKRFLGVPIRIDISVEIMDIIHNVGFFVKKVLGIGKNKIPCYVIEASGAVVESAPDEERKPKRGRKEKDAE